jgi:hypothetical protein
MRLIIAPSNERTLRSIRLAFGLRVHVGQSRVIVDRPGARETVRLDLLRSDDLEARTLPCLGLGQQLLEHMGDEELAGEFT